MRRKERKKERKTKRKKKSSFSSERKVVCRSASTLEKTQIVFITVILVVMHLSIPLAY